MSRISFDVIFGSSLQKQPLKIDFITSESSIKNVVQTPPANRISLGLAGECDFRLLALEHQIADKVCGMFETFNGYPSSRDKDLIDILLLAMTYSFKKRYLQAAVSEEMNSRNLSVSCDFESLYRWKAPFARKKEMLPARLAELDIQQALEIAERFLDLDNQVFPDAVWDPNLLIWEQERD